MSAPAAKALSLPPRTMQRTASSRSSSSSAADELLHQLVRERVQCIRTVQQDDRDRAVPLDEHELAHLFLSTKRLIAAFGSSVAIESASQSRAWLIVSCHARSFQKFRCCFA